MAETPQAAPEPGSPVYLMSGQECEFIAFVPGGAVVRPMYGSDEEGQPVEGDPEFVKKYLTAPPVPKLHDQIVQAETTLSGLRNEIAEANRLRQEATQGFAEIKARAASIAALRNIFDFIDGKITHYVITTYSGPAVVERGECWCGDDKSTRKSKLLTLFGDSKGDLAYRLHRYSDGSGGSSEEVVPCLSLEEANKIAREKLDQLWAADRKSGHANSNYIAAAKKLGVEVPSDILKLVATANLRNATSTLASTKKTQAEAEATIAEASLLLAQ